MEGVKGNEYTIRNCITRRTKVTHLSNLHKYTHSEYHRAPEEAAMRDIRDLFIVERL